jgi:hypothetical protein
MSKANHDRNFIKLGTTKRDDKEWDRLEDRLQTDPNLGGGAELLVPGTYVPKVGLPPGVPYLYVIGNLLEGYPIDLALTGDLSPDFQLSLDQGDFFDLGVTAVLGKAPTGEVTAYKIPAQPVIISGFSPSLRVLLSADSTLFELPFGFEEASEFLLAITYSSTLLIRQPSASWSVVDLFALLGVYPLFAGEGSDFDGCLVFTPSSGFDPVPEGTMHYHTMEAIDSTGLVVDTMPVDVVVYPDDSLPNTGMIENGWLLIGAGGLASDPLAPAQSGTFWCRSSDVYAGDDVVRIGKVFQYSSTQPLSSRHMSIGESGIAWVAHQADVYGNGQNIVRLNLNNGTLQRYVEVLYDSTLTYPVVILDTAHIENNICAVAGYYTDTVLGVEVPIIVFLAIAPDGGFSVNMLEFPDYAGTGSSIRNMVQQPNGTLVFHLYSAALATTGLPASILFGITEYP